MKRSKEIIGVPVISIAAGAQVGTIKNLLINPQKKTIEFLLLSETEAKEGVKGLPFSYAEGVGEYAVTVENENFIIELSRIGVLWELLEKSINIIGSKVITRKGKYLGDACEFSVDTETGRIADIYFQDKEKENSIPIQSVITIGQEVLIVEDSALALPAGAVHASIADGGNLNFKAGNEKSSGEDAAILAKEDASLLDKLPTERELLTNRANADLDPADAFIRRQRQFLIGKTLVKDFQSKDGEVLAWENDIITEELFEKVYKLGAQKIMELALAVRD